MNISGIVIMGLLLVAGTRAFCQTSVIAHRSHGGSIGSFVATGADNFGMPPKYIDSVAKLSDTSTIEFSSYGVDTVYHGNAWNNPKLEPDSLRRAFPNIKFIGFEKAKEQEHAGRLPVPARRTDVADLPATRHDGVFLLAMLCSVAAPSLAYGIWRAEKRRNR